MASQPFQQRSIFEAKKVQYSKMNSSLLVYTTFTFSLFFTALCQTCPSAYLRYSKEHSYCKPTNRNCPIFHGGVSNGEKKQIVDIHNKYRSKVATGEEFHAGGLPEAADMMQMVWDPQLAAISQRRAEQCIYEHDCSNCRRVENFGVGQNIAYKDMQCRGAGECPLNPVPDWPDVIRMFYDEVSDFDKKYVRSMKFVPGKKYGHFTQVVWAKTWRIGCGFVAFRKGSGYRQLYVCNYGPNGNTVDEPMYKSGPPCSSCPTNSCCGKSCRTADYPGLCRMLRNHESPIYKPKEKYIFHCNFRNSNGDCNADVEGANKWKFVKNLGGSYAEVVLKGGETSTLKLKNPIKPKKNFCLIIKYRSGPTLDGKKPLSKSAIIFHLINNGPVTMNLPKDPNNHQFFTFSIDLNWSIETRVSITFSVPENTPDQFFNVQQISAKNGNCR